ncbi:uncharacterized protein BXZ73DRAFT_106110 [Epithele typhae]|uniref:uncharacterized protein n=1 Tax=Epithele typhae TaxID=378194 RepID=UPI002007E45F|nr:uncharacterized protein BXZ73DRAFT_106110 [Epithele typhae]KAH9915562.1 hypothetical protein BXZ73DRAFT_106110 [Epithele typhae]
MENAAGEAAQGAKPEASALQVARGDERCAAWNSTPPINRLPTELLLRIFAACFQPTSFVEDDPRRTHLRRTVLLLVCRGWRDFIESTPTLWTFVSPHTPPPLYDLLLSRAAGAGLDFSFKCEDRSECSFSPHFSPEIALLDSPDEEDDRTTSDGEDDDDDDDDDDEDGREEEEAQDEDEDGEAGDGHSERGWIIDCEEYSSKVWSEVAGAAIATQSKRTRSLALVDSDWLFYTLQFFEALFQDRTWPILTDLFVDHTSIDEGSSPPRNAEFFLLTQARFPKLQHLTLDMVLPIEPALFPQLRTLNLIGPTVHWPPLEDFLLCLSQSPQLEILRIRQELDMSQDGPTARHYPPPAPTSTLQLPLTLPHLRSLSLGAARHEEVKLLLRAFPLARPDLYVTGLFNEDWRRPHANVHPSRCLSILDAFFPDCGDTVPIPVPRSVQRLYVYATLFRATIKGLADDDPPTTLFEWSASSTTRQSLDGAGTSRYGLSCGINDVVTLFSGSPLRRISFSTDDVCPADGQWDRLFTTFPALEHLELIGNGAPIGLLHALTPAPSLSSVTDSGPCRALRELGCFVYPAPEAAEVVFQTIVECLRTRARHGMHPLRQVEVRVPVPSDEGAKKRFQFGVGPYLEELRELVEGEVDFRDIASYD